MKESTKAYLVDIYNSISKGVMWYRRNANLYCQSWEIQRG